VRTEYLSLLRQFGDFLTETTDGELRPSQLTAASLPIPYTETEWVFDTSRFKKERASNAPGEYEDELVDFMCRPVSSRDANQLVYVVVGGLGTGKSTTLERCYQRFLATNIPCPNSRDSQCKRVGKRIIRLNFYKWSEHQSLEELPNPADYKDKLWNSIARRLKDAISRKLTVQEEISDFWFWCLKQSEIQEQSKQLQRFFDGVEPKILALKDGKDYFGKSQNTLTLDLVAARDEMVSNLEQFDSHAYAYYCVLLLKYELEREGGACSCTQLFVDNLDHVTPEGQVSVAYFAKKLSDYLNVRTLIAVRPLTFERSIHAHVVDKRINHQSPDIGKVVATRIDSFVRFHEKQLPDRLKADLESVRLLLSSTHVPRSPLSTMVEAAAGLSIRNGLFSVRDMLCARVLYDKKTGYLALRNRRKSDLVHALFFGQDAHIDPKKFENLYSVHGGDARAGFRLIKPRILDFIIRIEQGQTTVKKVFDFMSFFWDRNRYEVDYGAEVVRVALNELMLRYRPLLWFQDGFSIDDDPGYSRSNGALTITHIGQQYWSTLFGELLYEEACLTDLEGDGVTLERVLAFHKELTDQDLLEAHLCKIEIGQKAYNRYYPPESHWCISLEHWAKLRQGLEKRLHGELDDLPGLDVNRDYWIAELSLRQGKIRNALSGILSAY
jgi:hypothetical protein